MRRKLPYLSECPLCAGPFKPKPGREYITISFVGNKKFKQAIVNAVSELFNNEDFASEVAKPGCGVSLHSTMVPTEVDQ